MCFSTKKKTMCLAAIFVCKFPCEVVASAISDSMCMILRSTPHIALLELSDAHIVEKTVLHIFILS